MKKSLSFDRFVDRHIGPDEIQVEQILATLGFDCLDDLIANTVPHSILREFRLDWGAALSESQLLASLREIAAQNQSFRSFIGMGYVDCITPPVIQRNILENPGWYTQYTPYQSEIAQGRLEALLNFQTAVADLTGLEIANASLLDEGTAAAEAMAMLYGAQKKPLANVFFISASCHPQTIEVVRHRAEARGLEVVVGDHRSYRFEQATFGVLLQYPATDGCIEDLSDFCVQAHAAGAQVVVAADLLSLVLLRPPGEFGADVAVGSTQRFGMPMGYGGPHAAFFATREAYKRLIPGRLIGVTQDALGNPALRMALQTREQHIRREKATSNICTAQVLPAVVASMYAVYHGPAGLRRIAERVHTLTLMLEAGMRKLGIEVVHKAFFDTLNFAVSGPQQRVILERARERRINLRLLDNGTLGITLGETTGLEDLRDLLEIMAAGRPLEFVLDQLEANTDCRWQDRHCRTSDYMKHPVFSRHHSETQILRYMSRLERRDLSLTTSMIPLGSCTMKLNATAEMTPITWPAFSDIHPFAPLDQAQGYHRIVSELEDMLRQITGMAGVSLQPNAGSQGEYAGLQVIKAFHASRGQDQRRICLIPASAHGTNPASAVMAGFEVRVVACDQQGNIDLADLRAKADQSGDALAALMVTYPSTHGVFEEDIEAICAAIHQGGGQVYMDGANMNALVGLCRPAEIGVDVCHLNLHKTFCIPHGGGGPGMGPIVVGPHLIDFLPNHPLVEVGGEKGIGAIAAAPWSSALILLISWAYLKLMGGEGTKRATQIAILNANYIARRLDAYFPVLYKGKNGLVAHEAIVDLRQFKKTAGIEVEDVAKRLMDYGFHAPTVSFPVPGTLMIEPTESEAKEELDRFCDAMIAIHGEIQAVADGRMDRANNPLKNAPHTQSMLLQDEWNYPYSRQQAALPAPWVAEQKFWPAVARLDNALGDRQLICTCPPLAAYA